MAHVFRQCHQTPGLDPRDLRDFSACETWLYNSDLPQDDNCPPGQWQQREPRVGAPSPLLSLKPRLGECLALCCSVREEKQPGFRPSSHDPERDGFPTGRLGGCLCVLAESHRPLLNLPSASDTEACLRVSGWLSSSSLARGLILFAGHIPSAEVVALLAAKGRECPATHPVIQLGTYPASSTHPPS